MHPVIVDKPLQNEGHSKGSGTRNQGYQPDPWLRCYLVRERVNSFGVCHTMRDFDEGMESIDSTRTITRGIPGGPSIMWGETC